MSARRSFGRRTRRCAARLGIALVASGLVLGAMITPAATAGTSHAAERAVAAPSVHRVAITWRQRAIGLDNPVQVTSARDGSSRLFVVEQPGVIKVFSHGHIRSGNYLNITGRVTSGGEQGLLSVAFDPQFTRTHRFWVAYTRGDGALVLARFRAPGAKAGHVRSSTGRTVLVVPHPVNTNHNGGQLMFGPDGLLYLGTGDGGSGGDPPNNAQNTRRLLGKILRIDVHHQCGGMRYCVPRGNPLAGKRPGRGEIWLWGVRNPWRWSFDSATGDLWIGDVGQDAVEEIDHVPAKPAVRNLGWSCWEGRQNYNTSRCKNGTKYLFPVTTVNHPAAEAIIGGFVYRGSRYRALMNGIYVFADDLSGRVWIYKRGQGKQLQAAALPGNPSGFGIDDHQEIWAVTLDGRLWAMRARSG
jgi:glucose/arabinose dehydrogenase